ALATIAIMDTYYGTISNEDGSFTIQVPDTLKQPILVSSYIGYKNHYTPISIESDEDVEILMSRNMISLQEVIIRYQDPASLLRETMRRVDQNYLDKPSGMHAYYRERVNKDDKTMVLSEAAVEIAKAAYTSSMATERSRILKGRKITNIELQDTVVFKIRSGLSTMLQLDIVKNPPGFLLVDFIAAYNLHFSDVVSFKDKLVYVIAFRQKESIDETLFRGNLYIDRETLALIAADFEYDPVRLGREERMFVNRKSRGVKIRPLSARYHVEYKQSDSRFHLSQVQGKVIFKVRKKRQWIASKYEISLEMVITHTDPGNPPHISYSEQLKPSTILAEQQFEYDPEFWGDYNTIKPEASLTEALKNIEDSMLEISVTE
ncbi:MAG: carboxypeptidase-like regulatory domain-containing protein, partial [Bacteroidales bacterium]